MLDINDYVESIDELPVGDVLPRNEDNHISDEFLEVCSGSRCVKVCWSILFGIYWWNYPLYQWSRSHKKIKGVSFEIVTNLIHLDVDFRFLIFTVLSIWIQYSSGIWRICQYQ